MYSSLFDRSTRSLGAGAAPNALDYSRAIQRSTDETYSMTAHVSTAAHAFNEAQYSARNEQASHLGPATYALSDAPQGNVGAVKGTAGHAEQPVVFRQVNTMDGKRAAPSIHSQHHHATSPTSPSMAIAHAHNMPCDTPRPNKIPMESFSENGSRPVKKVFGLPPCEASETGDFFAHTYHKDAAKHHFLS